MDGTYSSEAPPGVSVGTSGAYSSYGGHKRDFSGASRDGPGGESAVKLFVGSVPRGIREEEVRPMFEEFGNLLEVALIKDRRTGLQQGCCFVKYGSLEDAERAIKGLNNQRNLPGSATPVQVRFADGERERLGAVEHKLFVGSINKSAGDSEVEDIFSQFGAVYDVYIMRDQEKQSRGCAFVKFPNKESAQAAIDALNGTYKMDGCDYPLTVRYADPKRPRPGEAARVGGPGASFGTPYQSGGGGGSSAGGARCPSSSLTCTCRAYLSRPRRAALVVTDQCQ
eukprot:jgi/Mesen1/5855/ME000298S05126